MSPRNKIVLTGGPGGGKSTLIKVLQSDPVWVGRFAALPEAIFLMKDIGIDPSEKCFQRVMVHLQMALEDGLDKGLGEDCTRAILCHRGSLDPLAYWLDRGWNEEEFLRFSGTTRQEHYQRYSAVIHLVTAADGAETHYRRWPDALRSELIEDAVRLDKLLQYVWGKHPKYFLIDNEGKDWKTKADQVYEVLKKFI